MIKHSILSRIFLLAILLSLARGAEASDGVFCIQNTASGNFLSDADHDLWDLCSSGEKWTLTRHPEGLYCLKNTFARRYLGADGLLVPTCERGQLWEFIPEGDGSYCIKNRATAKHLGESATAAQQSCGQAERWSLIPILS